MNPSNLKLYELKFTTPIHISNERGDYTSGSMRIHSDTMYAAIWFSFNKLGFSDLIPNLENAGNTLFTISSLFPYLTYNNQKIRFLPRPLNTNDNRFDAAEDTRLRKMIKKVSWVDTKIFVDLLNDIVPNAFKSKEFINGQFWASKDLPNFSFVKSHIIPRAMVPREDNKDTTIFYIERYYFDDNAGLYFLANFENKEIEKAFDIALNYLSEEGLGTDRNIGNGKFEVKKMDNDLILETSRQRSLSINLGLFCPSSQTDVEFGVESEFAAYELVKRGGWISEPYNTLRKKSVYMFKEGSVFNNKVKESMFYQGENVDLKPDILNEYPIWRCGKTLFLTF